MSTLFTPGGFKPTGVPATYRRCTDWPAWGLVLFAGIAAGPVLGGGYMHPVLIVGSVLVFGLSFAIIVQMSLKSLISATWLCMVQALVAMMIALVDVIATHTVLPTPDWSLVATAVLSLVASLLLLRRIRGV